MPGFDKFVFHINQTVQDNSTLIGGEVKMVLLHMFAPFALMILLYTGGNPASNVRIDYYL
jgi:hypothetical protein